GSAYPTRRKSAARRHIVGGASGPDTRCHSPPWKPRSDKPAPGRNETPPSFAPAPAQPARPFLRASPFDYGPAGIPRWPETVPDTPASSAQAPHGFGLGHPRQLRPPGSDTESPTIPVPRCTLPVHKPETDRLYAEAEAFAPKSLFEPWRYL